MAELLTCPSCNRQLQVPDTLKGQDVQCPTCGATFVAQPPGAEAPVAGAPQDTGSPSVRPAEWNEQPAPSRRPAYDDRAEYGRIDPDDTGRYDRHRRRGNLAPHRGGLILALGLIGFLVCPVTSPIAWIMGNADLAQMRAGRMDPEGEGLTQAGRILGMIECILCVLGLCFVGAWILFFVVLAGAAAGRAH